MLTKINIEVQFWRRTSLGIVYVLDLENCPRPKRVSSVSERTSLRVSVTKCSHQKFSSQLFHRQSKDTICKKTQKPFFFKTLKKLPYLEPNFFERSWNGSPLFSPGWALSYKT